MAISTHIPVTQGKHILWVDTGISEFGLGPTRGEKVHYYPRLEWSIVKGNFKMRKKLRQFVNEDMQKDPSERIDSVLLYPALDDEPTAKLWHALDGLSPKHLELVSTYSEDCHIEPLNTLKHQWNNLESLSIGNVYLLVQSITSQTP